MLKPMTSVANPVVVFYDSCKGSGMPGRRVYLGRAANQLDARAYIKAQTDYRPGYVLALTSDHVVPLLTFEYSEAMALADALKAVKAELAFWIRGEVSEDRDYSISVNDDVVNVRVHYGSEAEVTDVMLQAGLPLRTVEVLRDYPLNVLSK